MYGIINEVRWPLGIRSAGKTLPALLLLCCILILVGSSESKDRNRSFSGRVVDHANHGVPGVVVHLRPQDVSTDEKPVAGGEVADKSGSGQCPPPELCETTAHNGNFSFHQVKTGLYDLVVSKGGQVLYTKPEPLLIPEMPVNTNLVIYLPQQSQN
jgi:hypothetical protein